mgnify:CR=1 FL=1|uniref:Sialidase domain-containing protein n=2 Tax=root TaxID=1 RepID=A0A6G7MAD8_9ZZZZ|nr:hypothetical protein [uncultured organism]
MREKRTPLHREINLMLKAHVFVFAALQVFTAQSADIPTDDMLLWLRADRVGQPDESNGVEVWQNHAPGTPRHAIQSKPEWRPRWVPTVESLGGQAVLVFDGKDDFLHVPWLTIGAHATVFIVAENSEQTAGGSHWRTILGGDDDSFREGATKYAFGFRRADQERRFIANVYYTADRSHRLVEPNSSWQQQHFHIYGFRRQGATEAGMTLRVDGVQVAAVTAHTDPPGFPGTGYTIGQGGNLRTSKLFRFYRGRIAEVLVYDRPLALIETLRVEKYLAEKYSLWRECSPPTRGLSLWFSASSLKAPGKRNELPACLPSTLGRLGAFATMYRPREINGRPALDFGAPDAQFDFGGWQPPDKQSVFAAVRERPGSKATILRELPDIASDRNRGKGEFRGMLAELLIYDRELSSDEAQDVIRYLDLRYSESTDPRCFENGRLIFRNGYNDQPYVVRCGDGSWLCVITTSAVEERGDDRTLVVTRSRDQGQSWSEVRYAIEPPDMRQPSWATLYVAPYGRVYAFYNLRERPIGQRARIDYVFKYSDDHGETWSQERYRMPIREIALDHEFGGTGGWGVCPPIEIDSNTLVSYTRFAPPGRSRGQGFVFRSDNLQSERDPKRIRWEMLPAGNHGIRANDVDSDMQEEHIITRLANGDLFCIWRTTSGYACQSYSRDGGRTWNDCGPAVYSPAVSQASNSPISAPLQAGALHHGESQARCLRPGAGRHLKNPLACCRPFRASSGRYLLWFHNTGPRPRTGVYRPRDVVWLAGGIERDGIIHWSQPEVFLYGFDLPVAGLGMSYPDFIEEDGRLWVTTTDKEDARIFEIAPDLLETLWNQGNRQDPPADGLVLELDEDDLKAKRISAQVTLPNLLHGGFTVGFTICLDDMASGRCLLDCPSEGGGGFSIRTDRGGTLRIELDDGMNPPESWVTDPGLLRCGREHRVVFIVDGGPNLILALVDGILCDGGDESRRGWGRFSKRLMHFGSRATLDIGADMRGRLKDLRLYSRPLRVSEAASVRAH